MNQPQPEHPVLLPYNKVTSVFETKDVLDQALSSLREAGFAENDLFVSYGEEARQYIDPEGERHGFLFKLRRKYQRLQGTEKRMLDAADEAIDAGHYLLAVEVGEGNEELQVKARDAIEPLTEHSIYYCGQFTMTILRLGKN